MDWLWQIWESLTLGKILIGVALIVISFVVSTLVISFVMIKIPANYFHSDFEHHLMSDRNMFLRWTVIVCKNILGIFLILLGIVLSLPGVPGPGVLTVLIGLILVDIPGKRRVESMIIKRPAILSAVNGLRSRYKKPPLLLD
jgi:hypothetical protein